MSEQIDDQIVFETQQQGISSEALSRDQQQALNRELYGGSLAVWAAAKVFDGAAGFVHRFRRAA